MLHLLARLIKKFQTSKNQMVNNRIIGENSSELINNPLNSLESIVKRDNSSAKNCLFLESDDSLSYQKINETKDFCL